MKRLYVLIIILLLLGAFVGELMVRDSGYVLLSYQNTTVETSLWGLMLIVVVGFGVLHYSLKLMQYILSGRQRISEWNQNRARNRANKRTQRGLHALAAGHYSKAHFLLIDAAEQSDLPLVNYITAAQAAHEQGEHDACDRYLDQALKTLPKAAIAIHLVQAEIQLERGQLDSCATLLRQLHADHSRHQKIMRMLTDVYQRQGDWKRLSELLPALKRNNTFSDETLQQITSQTYAGLLDNALKGLPVEADLSTRQQTLNSVWKSLPKDTELNQTLALDYARQLVAIGAHDEAESFVREAIKKQWADELVKYYGEIASSSPAKQLRVAESWKDTYPDSAALMLTLGRLSLQNKQWSEARGYFEQSLALQPSQECYNELARLLTRVDDKDAFAALAERLESVITDLPKLPLPEKT